MNDQLASNLIGLSINNLILAFFLPKVINDVVRDVHKDCNLHCKYKRMIVRGEL